jgi:DDE superfamily endonuclease
MQLTHSFLELLQQFAPVFTTPTHLTFIQILTGWIVSHRHRYITEIIFSGGNLGHGHWSRFHRFFSHSAWDMDVLLLHLAKLAVSILAPGATLSWAVDDTLCRKRGLSVYGAGMHYDPLISSRAKALVSWGHDWVVLCLIVERPIWAPTKVFALPIAMRLYRNRQGLTKGTAATGKGKTTTDQGQTSTGKRKTTTTTKARPPRAKASQPKGKTKIVAKTAADINHRTRPQLASELIRLVSNWFPNDQLVVSGDSAYGGRSVLSELPKNVHLISHVHPKGARYAPAPPRPPKSKGAPRKKGPRLPGMAEWAADLTKPWTELKFDQFGLHTTLQVKTQQALYYKSGGSRLLTIVLTRDGVGKRPDQMFYCTKLDWEVRQILSTYASRWAIECTFQNSKQLLGLEDPANRLHKAVLRTAPMAMVLYTLAVVWFHQGGYKLVEFPVRPWYGKKKRETKETSFADILTTLRRVSAEEKLATVVDNPTERKTWLRQMTELLVRAG